MLVSAGAVLCLFAAPAGALAGTPSTQVAPPAGNAAQLLAAGADTCGYPDASSALASTVFNENETNQGISVVGMGASAKIAVFGTDEASILLGMMPTNPNSGNGHLVNPPVGDTTAKDTSNRPLFPSIYVTDLTTGGAASRAGDWQQGGTPTQHIDDIFGSWTTASGSPAANTYQAIKPASANGSNLGTGSDTPPATAQFAQYGTEVRWNASSLGLITGHMYRFQVILHDGDQNKSGGDTGEACATLTIPGATFSLAKSVVPSTSPVPVGTPLAYTITLKNTSAVAGDPGVVTDTITTTGGLTYHLTGAITPSVGTVTGPVANVISWTPGSLAAGQSETLKYTLVPDSVGHVKNTAVNTNTNCPTADNPTCTTNTDVVAYKLSKSVSPSGPVKVGTPLNYTVTISNLSATVPGDPGTITDTPSTVGGATFSVSTQPTVSAGTVNPVVGAPGPEFAWAPGTLPAGGVATLTMVLTPTSAGTGTSPAVDNTAFDTNTNCATPGVAACTTHTPLTNFALSKTVTPTGPVTIGSILTYTVKITNLTTQAGDPGAVSDVIKTDGVTYSIVSAPTGSVTGSDPNFSWLPGSLAGNASATTTMVVKVTGLASPAPAAPTILNTAFNPNTNCPLPLVPDCTPITPVTDFLMSKTVSPSGAVNVGDTLTYTVKITNTTATSGDPGKVTDTITATGVQYTITGGPSTAHGTVSGTASPFTWTVGPLAGNSSATLTLVIKVTGVTPGTVNPTIVNTAVDINTNCPTAGNPDCTTNTPLIVLTLTKTVDKTTTVVNDTVTYTIRVGNVGAATATNVLVDDVLGGTAGYLVNDGTGTTTNSFAGAPAVPVTKLAIGHYQWTYAAIKPGDVDTVTFTAKITLPFTVQPNTSGTIVLTNTVSVPTYVTGVGTYVNPGNNPSPVTVSTTAPYNGGVLACTTATCPVPNTGASLNITLAGFLFLGGLGLILIGALARKREDTIS
jgi:uncharacterized repeat protein (TIGR01451 family)